MHGRLKVRTSAEEAIRKKKEQDLKAKAYRNGMDKILAMRAADLLDQNLLDLSAKILSVNPDLSSLWNIRRECILKMTQSAGEPDPALFDRDLGFTETCLQVQPKSYGAWHHRVWILENCPNPDWDREVKLCTVYLKRDERNCKCCLVIASPLIDDSFPFIVHVWDYRRYVVGKAKVPADLEFQFCDEKIQKNFSNYSSWHYRSQLLPILHPHETDSSRPILEAKLREELELVITAAFTDPNDSSAWFYQRWLLGYSDPKFELAAVKITENLAVISFAKPVDLARDGIDINVANVAELNNGKWCSLTGGKSDTTWIQTGNFQRSGDIEVSVKFNGATYQLETRKLENGTVVGVKCPKFGYEFGSAVMDELKNQLDSCNQLLEYEPDSKWTLLTASLLMRSIDRFHYHEKSLEFLQKLQKVDVLRAGYYRDLASKWTIEAKLKAWIESGDFQKEKVDLSDLDLSTVYYQQYFVIANDANLSGNPSLNKQSCKFSLIQGCKVKY